jgi:hypothetical protein
MPSGYKRRIEALERRAGRGDGPVRVVTEPDGTGGFRAFALTEDGPIELRRIRTLTDGQSIFTPDPGTPAKLRSEASLSDNDLLANASPAVVALRLGWVDALKQLHDGQILMSAGPASNEVKRVE